MKSLRVKISSKRKFANATKTLLTKQSKSPRSSLKMVEVRSHAAASKGAKFAEFPGYYDEELTPLPGILESQTLITKVLLNPQYTVCF